MNGNTSVAEIERTEQQFSILPTFDAHRAIATITMAFSNKKLYERHGFETLGAIQADTSPPMWPMLRQPR